MTVDEAGQYSLTKYTNKTGGITCAKESDHRTMILEINYRWGSTQENKQERIEIYNYKDSDSFLKFKTISTCNDDLKHCFEDDTENIEDSSRRWLKIVKNLIKSSFKKIRIRKNKLPPSLEKLFHEKEGIKSQIAEKENLNEMDEVFKLNDDLENVTEEISQICAEKNKDWLNEYLGRNNDVIEGYSQAKTWGLKKKLCPKNSTEAPAAKKDDEGNLVTDREALSKLYSETYKNRLKPNPVAEGYEELKTLKEYLFLVNGRS